MFYLYLSIFHLIISFLEFFKKKKLLFFLSIIVFICISGLRYKTGIDWISYTEYYNKSYLEIIQRNDIDFGYVLLMTLFKTLKLDYYFMQFFISIFVSFCLYLFYIKNSNYPLFCIYIYINLYYLRYNMGLERQAMALALCLIAYEFNKNKHNNLTLFCFIISMLFHFSAIIFFLIFYLYKFIKIKLKIQIILILLFLIFNIFKIDVINIMLQVFLFFSEKLQLNFIANKIIYYISNEYYSNNVGLTKTFIAQFLVILIVFIFRKPKTVNEEKIYFFTTIYILITFLSSTFYVLDRLQSYFGIFAIVLTGYVFDLFKKNIVVFLCFGIYFLCPMINFALHKETRHYMRYVPYYNIFYKVEDVKRWKAEIGLVGK